MTMIRRLRSKAVTARLRADLDVLIDVEIDGSVSVTFDGSTTPLLRFPSTTALCAAFGVNADDFEETQTKSA